jgi:hypothetical protein
MSRTQSALEESQAYWLILSHSFNQDGQASSQTITDKLPYLKQRRVDFTVLSGVMGTRDKQFHHVKVLPWGPSGFGFDLRQLARQYWGRDWRYRIFSALLSTALLPFVIIERLLFGLQSQASWAPAVVFRCLLLIAKRRPAVIYSTGGAYSAHLAGYWLKKLTGITWLAEVHDPMVTSKMKNNRNARLVKKIEGYICSDADLAWWFTDQALASAKARHPELGNRGVVVLPGVERLPSEAIYQRGEKMVISHFGLLASTRSMLPIVQAVAKLLETKPTIRETLRFHIYGSAIDAEATEAIAKLELSDLFISFGRLEKSPVTGKSGRQQVIDLMYQADCLLLLHGNFDECREYIPSKFYEYLWAGRPIIALTHQNPQLDQMLGERNNYLAATDSLSTIVHALETAHKDWLLNQLPMPIVPALGVKQAVDSIFKAYDSIN